jgi:DNA helicase-2/ATP-dependent DNA helicase PcrA
VKKLLKAEGIEDDVQFTDDAVRRTISAWKNAGIAPAEARLEAEDRYEERMAHLYHRYQDDLRKNNGMDFDDLIFLAIRLLQEFPGVREVFSNSFRHILVDEYQDTNRAQYKLIRLLIGPHRNLVVVGDDDQSIYGWRGADIQNILSFQKDFPDALVTRLEQNYRSTGNILAVANSVIRNNRERMEKRMWTSNEAGSRIGLIELEDELLEANWVARRIREESKYRPGDTAVFYRTNSQSRVLEDELRRQRIPYLIVGGIRFYERKEVKDLLAYLRALSNPRDEVALLRIVNVPKRGIGERSVAQVQEFALNRGIPLLDALARAGEAGVNSGTARRMEEFTRQLATLRALSRTEPLPTLIAEVINRTGYKAHLEEEATDESMDRLANVEELVSAAQDFLDRRRSGEISLPGGEAAFGGSAEGMEEGNRAAQSTAEASRAASKASDDAQLGLLDALESPGGTPAIEAHAPADEATSGPASGPSVPASSEAAPADAAAQDLAQDLDLFLQEISLVSDADTLKASQEAVVLMTVHSAKGLEFPRVFVTGLEDGLFPLLRNDGEGDVEEERRLFYVAVTRAREELSLSYARRRRRYGSYQEAGGSRFFGEMDRQYIQVARPAGAPRSFGSGFGGGGYGRGYGARRDDHDDGLSVQPAYEDYSQEEGPSFRKGQKVRHGKFGVGTVMGASGSGDEVRVEIVFSDHIRRTLLAKFARLEVLDS